MDHVSQSLSVSRVRAACGQCLGCHDTLCLVTSCVTLCTNISWQRSAGDPITRINVCTLHHMSKSRTMPSWIKDSESMNSGDVCRCWLFLAAVLDPEKNRWPRNPETGVRCPPLTGWCPGPGGCDPWLWMALFLSLCVTWARLAPPAWCRYLIPTQPTASGVRQTNKWVEEHLLKLRGYQH